MLLTVTLIKESLAHTLNVCGHVLFGTLALGLGLVRLFVKKGGKTHVRFGWYFLRCLGVVILTAIIGVTVFRFRAFLALITMLATYQAYSGVRATRNRGAGPTRQDAVVSCLGLVAAGVFVVYIRTVRFPWSPVVIYSTLGALVATTLYDLSRFCFPKRWIVKVWFYEHLAKMIGAYSAIASAFSGTVLEDWQPYSQILPSTLGTVATVGFIIYFSLRRQTAAS